MADKTLLIGDIGGTNARFAMADPKHSGFSNVVTLQCADYASADDAIRHYIGELSAEAPDVVCLAVAGPVVGNSVQVTNNHWVLNAESIAADFGVHNVKLLNDFEAVAYSIPHLRAEESVAIGLPDQRPPLDDDFNIAILGPGTGLGTAGLIRRGQAVIPIVAEGGHVGFAPNSQLQVEVLSSLRSRFDRVAVEHLVSGPGIENIYWALTQIRGEQRDPLSAQDIFASGDDSLATETTQLFFEILGQVAGDLALVLGAKDGVYIAGGITKRYPELLQSSGFRNAFDNKDKYRSLMERIPTLLITHDEPGLLGAAYCALELSSV
jgi:glucokinase